MYCIISSPYTLISRLIQFIVEDKFCEAFFVASMWREGDLWVHSLTKAAAKSVNFMRKCYHVTIKE